MYNDLAFRALLAFQGWAGIKDREEAQTALLRGLMEDSRAHYGDDFKDCLTAATSAKES